MKHAFLPATLVLALAASTPHVPLRATDSAGPGERIVNNDNRRAAGRLENGVLTLRMEAREGTWYAEGPNGMARHVAAFAEDGQPLENPGPLIRVPAGTEVRVTIRNSLAERLTLFGLGESRGMADSVQLEPGAARDLRFVATTPGTYWYAGKTTPVRNLYLRRGQDSQLNGVIVVDPPGQRLSADDRIFLISWWGREDSTAVPEESASPGSAMVINGVSWPHTERFHVAQGDSLHWRWVSMTLAAHPMHLHGFYFRVDGRGDGARYSTYRPEERRAAVTEVLRPGETMAIAWSPSKPGNWIFHCHVARHMSPPRESEANGTANGTAHGTNGSAHATHGMGQHEMAGLVLGIHVKPNGEEPTPTRKARPVRLLIRSGPSDDGYVRYSYLLGGSREETDAGSLPVPGPTLVLEKDEPVAITVVNQSHEPAAVHWHGIELESFPDGVPGWSGEGDRILPSIPPRDSITVRFTPPRAGTFMYHSHFNEMQQIASGLFGALLVLDRGQRHDPDVDRVLLFSDPRPASAERRGPFSPLLNGQVQPEPMELRAGVTYRFRLINIRSNAPVALSLLDDARPAEWRAVAKDGADLPGSQAVARPAQLVFGPGEIYDYEFTPLAPGELKLRFGFPPPRVPRPNVVIPEPVVVAVRVR